MNQPASKTVLITGATQGIGLELARIFAKNGFGLVLAARNHERLKSIKEELLTHNINIDIYPVDLSITANAEFIFNDLKSKNRTINYLINNAGFGINDPYIEIDWQKELEMYNLNMVTLSYFTKAFARDMKEKGFGRILNIASIAAFQPGPYMAGYCATKAFVLSLSQAVNHELKGTNVSVSVLCPGVTDSLFHTVAQSEKTGMSKFMSHASSKDVANYGYQLMINRKSMGIYGLSNRFMIFTNRLASRKLSIYLSGLMLKKN